MVPLLPTLFSLGQAFMQKTGILGGKSNSRFSHMDVDTRCICTQKFNEMIDLNSCQSSCRPVLKSIHSYPNRIYASAILLNKGRVPVQENAQFHRDASIHKNNASNKPPRKIKLLDLSCASSRQEQHPAGIHEVQS